MADEASLEKMQIQLGEVAQHAVNPEAIGSAVIAIAILEAALFLGRKLDPPAHVVVNDADDP